MRKTKRNWTAAVCVLTAALSTTPVFAAKEKEGSTSKANTESISTDASAKDNGERTIIDHAGNEVTLPEEINRIVVTDTLPLPSVLSLYLDSAEKLVGISPVSMSAAKAGLLGELYPEILDADTSFFENSELNIESLLALEPDLVFYNAQNTELGESLTSAGLTAVAVSVTKWDYNAADTFDAWMDLLADIFPEEEEKAEAAKEYCEKVEDQIEEKTKDLTDDEKKNVFFLFNYSDTALVTSGKNFWGQYWCDAINAVNVGEEIEAERSNASVNMEQVYSWDPDIIFISNFTKAMPEDLVNMEQVYSWDPDIIFISNFTKAMPEDLYNNTIGDNDWSSVSAVKNEQVYKMPLGAYRSFTPGADTPMTLMWLAKTVYPDLFEDVDMTDEVQNYYDEVYGIELTDEQVAQMYTPSADAANGYGISK